MGAAEVANAAVIAETSVLVNKTPLKEVVVEDELWRAVGPNGAVYTLLKNGMLEITAPCGRIYDVVVTDDDIAVDGFYHSKTVENA